MIELLSESWTNFLSTPEYEYTIRILAASFAGLILGTERAINKKPASFRTFALVSSASCIFTILSVIVGEASRASGIAVDPGRIAAQVVSGVGFVGAGIIYKDRTAGAVEGITTAVMVWFAASLGMVCGFGHILLGGICLLMYIFILTFGKLLHRIVEGPKEN